MSHSLGQNGGWFTHPCGPWGQNLFFFFFFFTFFRKSGQTTPVAHGRSEKKKKQKRKKEEEEVLAHGEWLSQSLAKMRVATHS
jgi:hypothetical protein